MRRHKYPSEAKLRQILAAEGPLAAAAAECGGTLIVQPTLTIKRVGRGCGSPTPAIGTSSMIPCGSFCTDLTEVRKEYLCYYCEKENTICG